jgi:hypothetical protein
MNVLEIRMQKAPKADALIQCRISKREIKIKSGKPCEEGKATALNCLEDDVACRAYL